MRATAFLAMGLLLVATAVGAEPAASAPRAGGETSTSRGRVAHVVSAPATRRSLVTTSATGSAAASVAPWAKELAPIEVHNRNTERRGKVRLYDDHGALDRGAARAFMRLAGRSREAPDDDSEDDERLDLRLVKLVVRASYHFGGAAVSIVSGTRPGAHGKHGTGEALDFALEGVKAPTLAAYLRGTPRAGVGIYTHPKTQYVHLDVREQSFHWIDGSPPGVTWREQLLPDGKRAERDASYAPALDLPEAASASGR